MPNELLPPSDWLPAGGPQPGGKGREWQFLNHLDVPQRTTVSGSPGDNAEREIQHKWAMTFWGAV